MITEKPLYIFLHVPKTAGLNIRFHIRKNYNEHEYLLLSHELFGLESYPPPDYARHRKDVYEYFNKINKKRLRNIRIVFGHMVPYGVDGFFERPSKYITFVRKPKKRILSAYNYLLTKHYNAKKNNKKLDYINKRLLVDNVVPDFEKWLRVHYDSSNRYSVLSMFSLFKKLGYLDSLESGNNIKDMLRKFDFIGLTSNFSEDFLYISNELGFRRHFLSRNRSHKHVAIDEFKNNNILEEKSKKDQLLYKSAKEINSDIRETKSYVDNVRKAKIIRSLTLPFSQLLYDPKHTKKIILNKINNT